MSVEVFEARYYESRLKVVNPRGDVGVVTLWTPVATALGCLERLNVDLKTETSRIAVIGNLYGDGLPQMIRNLLWNPQINYLLIFGQDLSGSAQELENLLTKGVERAERLGKPRYRIQETDRYLDTEFSPDLLTGQFGIARFGKPSLDETTEGIRAFFANLPPQSPPTRDRVEAPLAIYEPVYFPSEPRSHTIVRRHPLDAWEELVFRVMRYGIPSIASENKERLELQNVKVVVDEPIEEDASYLAPFGFSLNDFREYQKALLDGNLPEGLSYSYGNRLRGYWKTRDGRLIDSLWEAGKTLAAQPTSRNAYVSLWDPVVDLVSDELHSSPCLVSLFFRIFQGQLTMTASFRSHNTMSAWLKNFYGLMAVQRFVADIADSVPCGPITVISNSISIDPTARDRLDLAQQIAQSKIDDLELDRETGKRRLREDPNGYFTFTIDPEADEIIAELKSGGETLTRYRGKRAEDIEADIARDGAISLLSHALYVGRQLALFEQQLASRRRK